MTKIITNRQPDIKETALTKKFIGDITVRLMDKGFNVVFQNVPPSNMLGIAIIEAKTGRSIKRAFKSPSKMSAKKETDTIVEFFNNMDDEEEE